MSTQPNPYPADRRKNNSISKAADQTIDRPANRMFKRRKQDRVTDASPSSNGMFAPPTFTFDDWASLYNTNPVAFETRRQAVLAIELAKLGPKGARARVCLANLEEALAGKTGPERSRLSMLWMAESATQLKDRLQELGRLIDTGPTSPQR
jgi:hypothetical protein